MNQIARIIVSQQDIEQEILTFNYDDYLERIIKKTYKNETKVSSEYEGKRGKKPTTKISVIHSHGYVPYNAEGKIKESHRNSIVLSNDEYMDNYSSNSKFSYKSLYNQLDKTNLLVGNSASDYQEQYVLRKHINDFPSKYSFILLTKSKTNSNWMDWFIMMYFLSLGLITIFFEDIEEIENFLKEKANNVTEALIIK